MSPELLSAIASVGTFVVITATAVAAIVQLYHLRSGNQIAILNDFRRAVDEPEFQDAIEFVRTLPDKVSDRGFRAELALTVVNVWKSMAHAVVVMRRTCGLSWFENFEYLAVISQRYMDRTQSVYPRNLPRIAPAPVGPRRCRQAQRTRRIAC